MTGVGMVRGGSSKERGIDGWEGYCSGTAGGGEGSQKASAKDGDRGLGDTDWGDGGLQSRGGRKQRDECQEGRRGSGEVLVAAIARRRLAAAIGHKRARYFSVGSHGRGGVGGRNGTKGWAGEGWSGLFAWLPQGRRVKGGRRFAGGTDGRGGNRGASGGDGSGGARGRRHIEGQGGGNRGPDIAWGRR